MATTPFDSALYQKLMGDAELSQLFADSAEIRAMLVVEGALAKAQASLGMIPSDAADAIHRDSLEVLVDPRVLADATAANGIAVPALVARFRADMQNSEASQYVHFGATTQDIHDTALALRLRQVCGHFRKRLTALIHALAKLGTEHQEAPMAARTWGMVATPTSFGAITAAWGHPLLRALSDLDEVQKAICQVSLSGASGTNAAMGPDAGEVRAELAKGLGLHDPGGTWHTARDGVVVLSDWSARLCGLLGKIGEDLLSMTRSGEVSILGGGASSTMPQKQNPVGPSLVVALSRHAIGLSTSMRTALPHRDQRDASAWMVEWMSLPQLCIVTGRALTSTLDIVPNIQPDKDRMLSLLDDGLELIYAEALSFHMARHLPRPEAQAAVKELCLEARALKAPLSRMAANRWPDQNFGNLFTPEAQLGDAPTEVDRFVAAAEELR